MTKQAVSRKAGAAFSYACHDRPAPATTRFAPSPTGHLHLGHVFSAHFAWRRAQQTGGHFLLRLEDIDPDRCRPAYAEAIEADLRWLGLNWHGPVLRQSGRLPLYRACLDDLSRRGLLYPCFCSRADIRREIAEAANAPHGPDGAPLYPGTCRALSPAERASRMADGAPHAWRLDMAQALAQAPKLTFIEEEEGEIRARPEAFGDVVLGRRDAPASYHLCVMHDDAATGITLITRARDLKPATHLHRLLQHLMAWPTPRYAHHRLLTDAAGARLSKRSGAPTVRALREAGATPGDVLSRVQSGHTADAP